MSTTNLFDFDYKKDFVEFPSNEDTKFLAISELLDLKLEKIEWEYEGGFIRRIRFILNNNTFARNFPCFGVQNKSQPCPDHFYFPEDVTIKKVKIYSYGAHAGMEFFDTKKKSILLIGKRTNEFKV